jgi:RNA polymerase I-specific transcription initiation factor RRN6
LSGFETVSEDTEGASQALREFLESINGDRDSESSTALVLSNLMRPPVDQDHGNESEYPDMWSLYDKLAEYWMESLPPNLTDIGRVARYRVVQQLAMDICLSSVCVSVENKLVSVERPSQPKETETMSLPILDINRAFSRDSSPTFFSSQPAAMSSQDARAAFPTPSKTPSEYSHTTSASEVKEDPAISRLRQYARSIKSKPDLGQPSILSHWPSQPGSDPALYSYAEAQKALLAGESGDESEHRNRKEEARRRRRTERFLRQERSRAVETAAQSLFKPSGSQPAVSNNMTSSQTVADLPMTQPVLGTFGSRMGGKEKKKSKKRRTAGFR